MSKENKRKIVIPFTLEQFKDTIERIKAEYNAGNLSLVGLFEIETLEYYCEKAKDNEQAQKQEQLLKLYQKLYKYSPHLTLYEQLEIEKQIKELEND